MPTEPRPAIRVVLVDDSKLVRHGIRMVLGSESSPRMEVVGEASTLEDAKALIAALRPDIILLDVRLPDGNGIDACPSLLAGSPNSRAIILTSFATDVNLYRAINAGAQGCLLKELEPASLIEAVRDVMAGGTVFDGVAQSATAEIPAGFPAKSTTLGLSGLTEKQARVLEFVSVGKTNIEIAEALNLSPNTVRNYLVTIFAKLGVTRRSQATAVYVQARGSSAHPFHTITGFSPRVSAALSL